MMRIDQKYYEKKKKIKKKYYLNQLM